MAAPAAHTVIARSACDEAIHVSTCGAMDCFAALAMTGRGVWVPACAGTTLIMGMPIPIYRNRVKPRNKKYFALPNAKSAHIFTIPSRPEGRIMIVTIVGRVAVDAEVPLTNGLRAYGEDVWS